MHALVLQSDFGKADGAVCAMYGVAESVQPGLRIFDLTHEIEQYDIWEGSYRLIQTVSFWPEGTVFVSVVDPGVGSTRRSIAALTDDGHYIITPDNGTLTHVKRLCGLKCVRLIDETVNRMPHAVDSYTFHGRDIYAFTGARLAAGVIRFDDIGPEISQDSVVTLPLIDPKMQDGAIEGTIDVLDIRFGSIWTNIPHSLFKELHIDYGERVQIEIRNDTRALYRNVMTFAHSFAEVFVGEPLAYINSLDYLAVAINQGSFARAYSIGTGNSWHIRVSRSPF